ncbi:hypothetical protein D3C76_1600980 [compost metagenome]
MRIGLDFRDHMLRHVSDPFGGMREVLLQQRRVAAVQLQLLGRGQRIAVQDVDATTQAAVGIP